MFIDVPDLLEMRQRKKQNTPQNFKAAEDPTLNINAEFNSEDYVFFLSSYLMKRNQLMVIKL